MRFVVIVALGLLSAPRLGAQDTRPPATRAGSVVDTMHGVAVPDPYRWLESLDAPEVKRWVTAQDSHARQLLAARAMRERFERRLTELWNVPRVEGPVVQEAGYIFHRRNTGLQRQSVIMARDTTGARVVLDPNRLSPDGSVALTDFSPSPDGARYAYALAAGGSDWQVVHLRDHRSQRALPDTLRWVKFSALSWTGDGGGFYYSRYPAPTGGDTLGARLAGHALYYHVAGTPQSQDRPVFAVSGEPETLVQGRASHDGRWLFVTLHRGTETRNRLLVADLVNARRPNVAAEPRAVFDTADARYEPLGVANGMLYVLTDRDAPRRRIVAVRAAAARAERLTSIVPERNVTIEQAVLLRDRIVLHVLQDARSRLAVVGLDGRTMGEVALPGQGAVEWVSGRSDGGTLLFAFTSPLHPTTIYRWDGTGAPAPLEVSRSSFVATPYETRQHFVMGRDSTRIPVFVTSRKGAARDGTSPTWLTAYGGFGWSMPPAWSPAIAAWLEAGGTWVSANLRGGGEYGEAWHRAGMLGAKQRVFDDFVAVAEWLVEQRYTSRDRLAIAGESNGGLLVGAVMEQRPELFGAALPGAGVMDMLRYHRFSVGAAWIPEYGSPEHGEAFRWLRAYSPVHNTKRGTCYPRTLVTAAERDDRVVPSHSYKFTAALQAAQGCARNPIVLRVETHGSHGWRAVDRQIEEWADKLGFAWQP